MSRPVKLGVADDGERASRKQAAQIAITLLADAAWLPRLPAAPLATLYATYVDVEEPSTASQAVIPGDGR